MKIYISCDVETNGPIPNPNSILQLGAAAFDLEGKLLSTFSANLEELPGGSACEKTMEWWSKQGDLYEKTRENQMPPEKVFKDFVLWIESQGRSPVFVGYPGAWDFSFVYWYLIRFVGRSPFSHSALDIKTLIAVAQDCHYRSATKANIPREWLPEKAHTHVAVDDAIEQGELFFNVLKSMGKTLA